jgi:hypothetical protein
MLTTCPATALASSRAHHAADADAPDNAPRDPARNAKPVGTRRCKNACTIVHAEWRKARNNQAERTAIPKNLPAPTQCAGPRAANPRQLTLLAAHAFALDSVSTARAAAACHSRSRDTAGLLATAANGEPRGDTLHRNNAI